VASTTTSALFTPLEFAGLRVKNRLVMAPMGSCQSDRDGFVTDQTVAYYSRRARGGVGMITVEAALVTPESHGHEPRLHGPEFVPGMRRVVDAIHEHEVTTGIQLMHPGRQVTSGPSVAPSAVPLNSRAPVPHALTQEEIAVIVAQYATAARLAQDAGFDFVEVHGAHGYLPSDFLSPVVNQRDDEYGGSLERRARFVLEVAHAITESVDIPLFWRLSGEELTDGGYSVDDQVQVARLLEEAGIACLSMSAGTWHTIQVTVAPMYIPRGRMIPYAQRIKQEVGVPVIAVGRLDDPVLAERVVAEGSADMVMIGRGLLADPDWPQKVGAGELDEVRPCIACNACVDLVARGLEMRCAVNPELGHENVWEIVPAATPRRVMVVGSGPAGMEAARIARLRGHDVSLWERDDVIGGKLDVASRAPSKSEVLRYRDYQVCTLDRLGVEAHTGIDVTPAVVQREDPDFVVIATGAEPLFPPIPGIDGPTVIDAQELLYQRVSLAPGDHVAIVGGSATGCETAELLLGTGVAVTIVEMQGSIGHGIEQITRRRIVKELRSGGVQVLTRSKVTAIQPGCVVYETEDGTSHDLPTTYTALAVGWRPSGQVLAVPLADRPNVVLGDAERPADFVAAVAAGAAAARAIA
jgi:2,4-dienoyl-CoA reductase-like NADH-dependent reductase (Old Yellow Enzyme family)/NADPH-dependent 2,4-dienoyl-CoA reductase/sulfur reductase-like enzyme